MVSQKPIAILPGALWSATQSKPETGLAVVIEDGLISEIRDERGLPADLVRTAAPDCTMLPGLMDCHVHLCDWMLPGFLAAGVTTVRDVGNDLNWILERRKHTREHDAAGPSIYCCGPLLDGATAHWPVMGRSHHDRASIEQSVKELAKRGVDAIKLYVNVTREQMEAAARVSHQYDHHILAHLGSIAAEDATDAGINEIEHLSGCAAAWKESTSDEIDALCEKLEEGNVVTCPTLVVWDRIGRVTDSVFINDRRLDWVHPTFRQAWRDYPWRTQQASQRIGLQQGVTRVKKTLGEMSRRGLPVICGTDTPFPYLTPGFSLHDELSLMVDAGLKPADALLTATRNAAAVLGIESSTGTIETGKRADLLLVRGDPTVVATSTRLKFSLSR